MQTHTPKQDALDAIQRLPDNVELEEISKRRINHTLQS